MTPNHDHGVALVPHAGTYHMKPLVGSRQLVAHLFDLLLQPYRKTCDRLLTATTQPTQLPSSQYSTMMRYPDYYRETDKENGTEPVTAYGVGDHLRCPSNSFGSSVDDQSGPLKDMNYRYSEDSHGQKRSSESHYRDYRESRESGTSSRRSKVSKHSHGNESRSRRHTNVSSKTEDSKASSASPYDKTIALFGVHGVTGHYFLQLAVEAGYHVRALVLPGFELQEMRENPNLTMIQGTLDDQEKIHRVIRKAGFVVCMLNECAQQLEGDASTAPVPIQSSNYDFVQKLVPLMSRYPNCNVLLYQASSYAKDTEGSVPMLTNVVKKMAVRKTRKETLKEQDRIVKYISKYQKSKSDGEDVPFHYIITRPSEMLWDRPSRKKLEASKSMPGPFPITNIDLAEFSLNALKMEKLYDTCPYVVQDGL